MVPFSFRLSVCCIVVEPILSSSLHMVKLSVEVSLDELRPLVIQQVQQAVAELKLTEPNEVVQRFNVADQHYQNPVVPLDVTQLQLACESEPNQPIALLIRQPVLIEAHKKEARGRHKLFPLTHVGNFETADEHAKLASGTINIHATVQPPPAQTKLSDAQLTINLVIQAVDLQPETDLGQALPIPVVRDMIQDKFKEKLTNAQQRREETNVVVGLGDKVPEQYKIAVLNSATATTNQGKNGVVVQIEATL